MLTKIVFSDNSIYKKTVYGEVIIYIYKYDCVSNVKCERRHVENAWRSLVEAITVIFPIKQ